MQATLKTHSRKKDICNTVSSLNLIWKFKVGNWGYMFQITTLAFVGLTLLINLQRPDFIDVIQEFSSLFYIAGNYDDSSLLHSAEKNGTQEPKDCSIVDSCRLFWRLVLVPYPWIKMGIGKCLWCRTNTSEGCSATFFLDNACDEGFSSQYSIIC